MSTTRSKKPKRSRREASLEATRAHVIETASRLFVDRGYGPTTVAAIAREAGVAVQTLYNAVGNKAALLSQVFESSVAGPEAPKTPLDFLGERTKHASDVRGVTHLLAEWFADVNPRMGPLWRVIEEASVQDQSVAELAREREQRRLDNYGHAAQAIAERGGVPEELDVEDVALLIWAVGHPQVYRTVVEARGWSSERYRRWVQATLNAAVAPTSPAPE